MSSGAASIGMPDANSGARLRGSGGRLGRRPSGVGNAGPAGPLVPGAGRGTMHLSPCGVRAARCESYTAGHAVHAIQARLVGERPWGWRDGVVEAWVDGVVRVRYIDEVGIATCWHHRDPSSELPVGEHVRLHEGSLHVLGTARGWYSVQIAGGLGAVPDPEQPELWAQQIVPGIVDLATGIAIATDRPGF